MGEILEKFMKKHLGVTFADVKRMNGRELDKLYDKACDLEIDFAMKADETESGETRDSINAAELVDFLYSF